MCERRRPAASLASLLVVTLLFVWACSSSAREDASVTASGGSGSAVSRGGARASEDEAGAEAASSGSGDVAAASASNDGGSSDVENPAPGTESSTGGARHSDNGGASSSAGFSPSTGGTIDIDMSHAGAPDVARAGAGDPASTAGTTSIPAAGGAPAVAEPVCDPAEDASTLDMFLPCNVSTALYVCRNCHSNPPVKGVFSSYASYADIKANAAKIYGVIKGGTMPRPPYTMSAWQKNTALKWLGKDGTCAIGATESCQ